MTIKSLFFSVIVCCVACFCGDDPDDVDYPCTEQYVYGLNVNVNDANTGQPLTEGVTVTATEEDYEEALMLIEGNETFVGAGERPGLYTVEVIAVGYQLYVLEGVFLDFDGCHVVPQVINVDLVPK